MPSTRTNTKPGAKKADDAKPAKASVASKTAAKAEPAEKNKKGAEEAAPAAKPAVKETVSLIDGPKVKRKRTAAELENKPFARHIPISRILEPEAPKAPTPPPVPEPVAPAPEAIPDAPAAEVPVEAPVAPSDEKVIHLKPPFTVKDLAVAMGVKPFQLIGDLMEMNIFASINQTIETDIAAKVCTKHGLVFEKEKRKEGGGVHKPEPPKEPPKEAPKPKPDELASRAPIVTFMGHVDHGKTTLMDAIRKTRVAAGEAGGITQHIGAYSVDHNGHRITFLDTPGHAAFTAMRARGANVTDIVVLVVAADDGIMPQTIEALNHARAAKVKIIVAITKMDSTGANLDKVKGQLQDKGLQPEDWGGDVGVCPVAALKNQGVSDLLDRILLESEMLELKASSQQAPRGTVIEAQIEQGRGPTATVIVRSGTLKMGDSFICGHFDGKVKSLIDDTGKPMKSAGPSTPVKVLGFSGLPNAGDEFLVMESDRAAKALSAERQAEQRMQKLATPQRATLENLFASLAEGQKKKLYVVIKGDVQGSLEALVTSLEQIESKKIDLEIVHSAVGPISESDILLASASNAIVIGFGVKVENTAAQISKRENVQIKLFSIIYELIDQVKEAMAGMLDPETRESVIGHAEVRKVFELSKGLVAGCAVTDGRLARSARARVTRGRTPIYDGGFATLRRFQDDVKEVRSGLECGIKLGDFNDYEVGDVIECYTLEKVAQKL
ncbi:MAG TPA: translation initiation factor IF-2 [Chthoniobacter sp.]|jgi:translation initiation factor IF-2